MKSNHKYKTAWLIGSQGGIGSEVLELMRKKSGQLCLIDRQDMQQDLTSPEKYWMADFSCEAQVKQFAEEAVHAFGKPELMVICAGFVLSKKLEETSVDEINALFENNFKVVALALKYFYLHCSREKDDIKNIIVLGSNAGFESRPNQPIYAAMKSAINSLIKSQAAVWGKYNIKINGIAPGTVIVPRNEKNLREKFPQFPQDPNRPLGRLAYPKDLVSIFEFLMDENVLMTGQIFIADGGSNLV